VEHLEKRFSMAFYRLPNRDDDLALNAIYIKKYKNYYDEITNTWIIKIYTNSEVYDQVFNTESEYLEAVSNLTNALSASSVIDNSKYSTWDK
jgi:hypothetical protein